MTANFRKLLLGAILLLTPIPAAWAQDRAVTLSLGTESRLALDSAFQTVIVGDPGIVDVRTDDDRSIVVEPRNAGATNLVFVNARGVVVANIRISVCAPSGTAACDPAKGSVDLRSPSSIPPTSLRQGRKA